jgi:hybrid polyketide synthase/nonribosomal peptide synthetase ACE1
VGNPREANAIKTAFDSPAVNGNPLYFGSIKTIIGHTEGTAGLAGVLNAALAIKNGTIPPNMLLNRLNFDVQQYCDTSSTVTICMFPPPRSPWPSLPEGVTRRASVNSFGM